MSVGNLGPGSSRDYKRGAVMGLTVAEAFILLSFVLLLLFTWWQTDTEKRSLRLADSLGEMTEAQKAEIIAALTNGTYDLARTLRDQGFGPADQTALTDGTFDLARALRDSGLGPQDQAELTDGTFELAEALREVGLGPQDREALTDGTYELAEALRKAGLGPQDEAAITDTSNYTRFMREEDLKRLMSGAVALPPGTRLKLSEAVEITPETRLRAALEDLLKPEDAATSVSQRLADAAAQERDMVAMLQRELGDQIRTAGGQITADGTVILPQQVLFDVGSDRIKDPKFLEQFCAPWVQTLQSSGVDISELKIEGHASSEGQPGQTSSQAFLYNLDLSQRRAQNALEVCLQGLNDPATMDWARGRLSSTGYSSARPVLDEGGIEDRESSRRVMFSMEMDREKLLDDIRDDLSGAAAPRAAADDPETASNLQDNTAIPIVH